MNPSSVLLRIKNNILVEFIYSQEQISGASKKYLNTTDKTQYLVNDYSMRNLTGNVETHFSVNSNNGYMAVVDVNEGFYYPNSNNAVESIQLPYGTNLKYDTIRFHIRSGYNFQDTGGFFSEAYLKTIDGNRISLLSQVVFKGDLSLIKYNNTPIRISEVTFDKYVEYKVLSIAEVLVGNNQTSTYFNTYFANLMKSPMIHLDFSFIDSIDSSEGYTKFYNTVTDVIHIPAYDGYNKLQSHLVEKESYFEYCALWDDKSIENFITALNSKAGNNFHVEHELAIYEQRGSDFYEVHRHSSVQKFNYDIPLKFRPILTDNVDGSMQVEYIMRFFNSADNTSIVKRALLNTQNVNPYLTEPLRINVPINNVHKVYNKVVRKDMTIENTKSIFDNKVIVPVYYSNVGLKVDGTDFMLNLVPFDNVYSIYINQEVNGQDAPLVLEPSVQYQLVFVLTSGEKVRVIENDITGKMNGVLNFKISAEQANIILRDKTGKFYINSVNDSIETNVVVGNWQDKEIKNVGVIDTILTEEIIKELQPVTVIEEVSTTIPVVEVPITDTNIVPIKNWNGLAIKKDVRFDFDLRDIPSNLFLHQIKNPVVGDIREVKVIPDGSKLPITIMIQEPDKVNTLAQEPINSSPTYIRNLEKFLNVR